MDGSRTTRQVGLTTKDVVGKVIFSPEEGKPSHARVSPKNMFIHVDCYNVLILTICNIIKNENCINLHR